MKLLFVLFAAACLSSCHSDTVSPTVIYTTNDPLIDSSATVIVHRVLDGDTFNILVGRDSFSVRILGIDAYEIKHDSRLDSQAVRSGISTDSAYALGQLGKIFADSVFSGKQALIVRDFSQPDFDTYNRLLRDVYYFQGSSKINYDSVMLSRHLALPD